jgi:GDP-L-fucose synthase
MRLDARIYVAGHTGLVGSALVRQLRGAGYHNLVLQSHAELDLTEEAAVADFFQKERPEYVFLAAAKVGGIWANDTFPAEFIRENLAIQTNVIHQAWRAAVRRLLFYGSSCIYPRECPQPIKEEYLLTGPLEPTNRPYALAKIAGVEMCWSYNRQYGTDFLAVMPTNMFGPGDNYDIHTSHALPALIRRIHEANDAGAREVVVWGSGTPRREYLFSDDMGRASLFMMNLPDAAFQAWTRGEEAPLINLGTGIDHSIAELALMIAAVVGYRGAFRFDTSRPDGTPRKLLDVSKLHEAGWRHTIDIEEGIRLAHRDFLQAGGRIRQSPAHMREHV